MILIDFLIYPLYFLNSKTILKMILFFIHFLYLFPFLFLTLLITNELSQNNLFYLMFIKTLNHH